MTGQDKEQLNLEISHIFDSGANHLRVFEMVERFIDSRNLIKNHSDLSNVRDLLLDFADYSENDKTSEATDECVDNYLDQKQ